MDLSRKAILTQSNLDERLGMKSGFGAHSPTASSGVPRAWRPSGRRGRALHAGFLIEGFRPGVIERLDDRPIGCIRNRRCRFCDSVVTDRSQSRSHGRKCWEPKRVTSRRM
jgi:hypothetical protein